MTFDSFGSYRDYDDFDYEYEPDDWDDSVRTCILCGVTLDVDWDDGTVMCDDCDAEAKAEVDQHAKNRDAKRAKVTGMVVSNRSIKSVIVPVIEKRGRDARRKGNRRAS